MSVLVDTSIWIDYFRGGHHSTDIDKLIDDNVIVINDIILAELVPLLKVKKQTKVINLLREISCKPLRINWEDIILLQEDCLNKGINKVGIPDLIIAQNAIQNNYKLYTLDKHFSLLQQVIDIELY